MAKATEPVGVRALDGTPVTFALNMVDVEPAATTKSLVLDCVSGVGATDPTGAESDTMEPVARTNPATSAHTPR
jgi:hypothetical protein